MPASSSASLRRRSILARSCTSCSATLTSGDTDVLPAPEGQGDSARLLVQPGGLFDGLLGDEGRGGARQEEGALDQVAEGLERQARGAVEDGGGLEGVGDGALGGRRAGQDGIARAAS